LEVVSKLSIRFKTKAERGGQPTSQLQQHREYIEKSGRYCPDTGFGPTGGFENISFIIFFLHRELWS
jgi:hypothetical protein